MDIDRYASWLRLNAPALIKDCTVNVIAPLAIGHALHGRLAPAPALLVSSMPPVVNAMISLVRTRSVDALSVFALLCIVLPLLACLGGGSGGQLQLRQKLPLLLFGLSFLGSAAIRRPLILPLARATLARESRQALQRFDSRRHHPHVRHTMMVMTMVWGGVLLAQFSFCCVLLEQLTLDWFDVVSPLVGYAVMGSLIVWTMLYRQCRARLLVD